MGVAALRGTAAAVVSTVLLALPLLLAVPYLFAIYVDSSGHARIEFGAVGLGVLYLLLTGLPLIAWVVQSWKVAIPTFGLAVGGAGYGSWLFLDGLADYLRGSLDLHSESAMRIGPVLAVYSAGIAVMVGLLIRALRRPA